MVGTDTCFVLVFAHNSNLTNIFRKNRYLDILQCREKSMVSSAKRIYGNGYILSSHLPLPQVLGNDGI